MHVWLFFTLALFSATCATGQDAAPDPDTDLPGISVPAARTGNYTLRCTTNAAGEITDSKLIYEPQYPEDPENIRIVLTDSAGTEQLQCVALGNARRYFCGTALLPTRAPDSLIGSPQYYCWRYNDCRVRNSIMDNHSPVPDYYLNYGDKYANGFYDEVRPKLSPEGKKWLDKTLLVFQVATEALVMENGRAELDDTGFRQQLFDLHPKVYEACGFFDLSLRDQLTIARYLDVRDILSKEGRTQIAVMARRYVPCKVKTFFGGKRS